MIGADLELRRDPNAIEASTLPAQLPDPEELAGASESGGLVPPVSGSAVGPARAASERQRDDRREDRERRREPQQTARESLGGWDPPASREAIHAALNSREGQSHE